jgi:transcriptional regulator with XRE-family HTH domain
VTSALVADGWPISDLTKGRTAITAAISRVENGADRPSVETFERIARAFGERLVLGFEDQEGRKDLTEFASSSGDGR